MLGEKRGRKKKRAEKDVENVYGGKSEKERNKIQPDLTVNIINEKYEGDESGGKAKGDIN